jgi:hypothetical protein
VDTANVNNTLFKHSWIVSFHAVISEFLKAWCNSPQSRLRISHIPQFYPATSTHKNSKCSHLVTFSSPFNLYCEHCILKPSLCTYQQSW